MIDPQLQKFKHRPEGGVIREREHEELDKRMEEGFLEGYGGISYAEIRKEGKGEKGRSVS